MMLAMIKRPVNETDEEFMWKFALLDNPRD
jgi:hypothetical protein